MINAKKPISRGLAWLKHRSLGCGIMGWYYFLLMLCWVSQLLIKGTWYWVIWKKQMEDFLQTRGGSQPGKHGRWSKEHLCLHEGATHAAPHLPRAKGFPPGCGRKSLGWRNSAVGDCWGSQGRQGGLTDSECWASQASPQDFLMVCPKLKVAMATGMAPRKLGKSTISG